MNEASRNQIAAADPAHSTWLTANAGSGKTRVLTDRVARLLLAGCAPERILCLTYTKAAATEMQNRLLNRLGQWAMLPEADLRRALAELGEAGIPGGPDPAPDLAPDLAEARRLFARAIEAPGGLKVQTIHSFCAALLRRFPLEAGVPMGFVELDDRSARALRAQIVEEMAEAGDPAMASLIALHSGDNLDGFLASLKPVDFTSPPDPAEIGAALGLPAGMDGDTLLAQVFTGAESDLFDALIPVLETGKSSDVKLAAKLREGNWRDPSMTDFWLLAGCLLTGAGAKQPFSPKIGSLPTKDLRAGAAAPFMPALEDLMARVGDARLPALALQSAQATLALHRFGHAFCARLSQRKAAHGWLDFDDLILFTARLLEESSMAQWVLFRLDGGIDHILVDEAQDTSPEQWRVIRRLTDEFTSGISERNRTLFVVGDPKQSIYSFQGADIAVFEDMRSRFGQDFEAVRRAMQQRGLAHSFRSSPAILHLVDAVFQGGAAQGLGDPPRHLAFRDALPGRVDIWPALPEPEAPEPRDWTRPVDAPAPNAADTALAEAVAAQISDMIGTPFMDAKTGRVRAITAGDILILVQRRGVLFQELIRACKAANLPVAGADRLKLAAELAVRDILATLTVLVTPEDDLFRLANRRRRGEYLTIRLRDSHHIRARDILADLADHTDFMRPYDLISRLLIRHGGRAALLARLGPEAEDGIEELLTQALEYESVEPPSLTGFLVWLSGDEVEVKRQLPGGTGGLIRVMTVHGSKGLESPVVILPETRKRRPDNRARTVRMDNRPVWRGAAAQRPDPVAEAVADQDRRQDEENRRLLYVALTRAESWLIAAAAGDTGDDPLDSWHGMIAAGAERADLPRQQIARPGIGTVLRLSFGQWPDTPPAPAPAPAPGPAITLPDWVHQPAPRVEPGPTVVSASALGGAMVLPGAPDAGAEAPLDPAAAMLRGTRLHLLLEHLPGLPAAQWPAAARAALSGSEGGLPDAQELAALLAEASAVIEAPDLAPIMSAPADAQVLREVALSAPLPGIGRLHGVIDRLLISDREILAVDYKSNTQVPEDPEQVPQGILRQMAAYHAALGEIWPGRALRMMLLWTASRSLMELPAPLLQRVRDALDANGAAS